MLRHKLVIAAVVSVSLGAFLACASVDDPPPVSDTEGNAAFSVSADAGSPEGGAAIVQRLGCHGCHDSTAGVMAGNAAGVLRRIGDAGTFRVFPANLTPDPKTGLGTAEDGWSDSQIARAIRTGVDDECLTLCKVMPHFPLSDAEAAAVIAYLRALPPVVNAIANQGCPNVDPNTSGSGQFVDAGDCPAPEDGDAGGGVDLSP